MTLRPVLKKLAGQPTTDGAGVSLKRFIGSNEISFVDPFLLLDEFKNEDPKAYIAGFPEHPHRGFETVSYMIEGRMRHRDSRGNSGLLTAGSAQWMTAARGIIHSEMPEMDTSVERPMLWGYQLWVNLPAHLKMSEPRYQDIPPEKIPEVETDDFRVRLIAGEYAGKPGAAQTHIPVIYFDIIFKHEGIFRHEFKSSLNALLIGVTGDAKIAADDIAAGDIAVFGGGDAVEIAGKNGTRVLLIAAEPIGEPVARYGPFVMNTKEEIYQAFADYEAGKLA
ncbi:MAG: pirin family protein [Turneriella sp.]